MSPTAAYHQSYGSPQSRARQEVQHLYHNQVPDIPSIPEHWQGELLDLQLPSSTDSLSEINNHDTYHRHISALQEIEKPEFQAGT